MSVFKSFSDMAEGLTRIATAPVEIAVDCVNAVIQPIADDADELVRDVKDDCDNKQG